MSTNWIKNYQNLQATSPQDEVDFDIFSRHTSLEDVSVDTDACWHKFRSRIQNPSSKSYSAYWKVAAAVTLLLAAGMASYMFWVNMSTEVYAENSRMMLSLPEGTQVTLAPGTKLTYQKNNFAERIVQVAGEAYFDVVKSDNRFTVHLPHGAIEVLGTSFNVKTGNTTEISLESGQLEFIAAQKAWPLEAGERLTYDLQSGLASIEHMSNHNASSWKTGVFQFDGITVKEAAALLEKFYAVPVVVDASVASCKVSGYFSQAPLNEIIASICLATGSSSSKENDTIYLRGTGCD